VNVTQADRDDCVSRATAAWVDRRGVDSAARTVRRARLVLHRQRKASPYSSAERSVPELIPVLSSQPAGDASHKPGGMLSLLSPGLQLPSQPLRGLLPCSFATW